MSVKLTELKDPRLEASEPRLEARDPRLLPEDTVRVLADRLQQEMPTLLEKRPGDPCLNPAAVHCEVEHLVGSRGNRILLPSPPPWNRACL